MPNTRTIPLDRGSQAFYAGVAAADYVIRVHEDSLFPDQATRVAFFWFYAGALATGEGFTTQEELGRFVLGANTRAPRPDATPPSDEEPLYLECGYCGEVFSDLASAFEHAEQVGDDQPQFTLKPESEAF